jgi:uncharacterized membrane protein
MTRSLGSWIVIGAFLLSGTAHLVAPEGFLWLMPPFLPESLLLIYLSGVAELTAAIGLLLRLRFAPAFTVLVLLAVWPANWWFAIDSLGGDSWWTSVVAWFRLPLQLPLIWWAWRSPRRGEDRLLEP